MIKLPDPRLLTKLDVREVSLVDRPASPGAHVVLHKHEFRPCSGCASAETCTKASKCAAETSPASKGDPMNVPKSYIADQIAAVAGSKSPEVIAKAWQSRPDLYDTYLAAKNDAPRPPARTTIAKSAAEYRVDEIVADIRKSDPRMTREQAVAKAWRENPDEYEKYLNR